MVDELHGRIWVAHHEAFGEWVEGALANVRAAFHRLAQWDGSTHQLLAMAAAFAITALTFNATAA